MKRLYVKYIIIYTNCREIIMVIIYMVDSARGQQLFKLWLMECNNYAGGVYQYVYNIHCRACIYSTRLFPYRIYNMRIIILWIRRSYYRITHNFQLYAEQNVKYNFWVRKYNKGRMFNIIIHIYYVGTRNNACAHTFV